jgi:hypothetical protein
LGSGELFGKLKNYLEKCLDLNKAQLDINMYEFLLQTFTINAENVHPLVVGIA